jgi:hypothetical protein
MVPDPKYNCRVLPEPGEPGTPRSEPETPDREPPSARGPRYIPLFFEFEKAEPNRSGDFRTLYSLGLSEAIHFIQQGYTVSRIVGQTSPEGPLHPRRPGGFNNEELAKQRAARAERDLRLRIKGQLMLQLRDSPERRRLQEALQGDAWEGGEASAELFGSTKEGVEIPGSELPGHLRQELSQELAVDDDRGEADEKEDPLVREHVLGEDIPAEFREVVAAEVAAFRGEGEQGAGPAPTEAERTEHLYNVLRRALIVLNPPERTPGGVSGSGPSRQNLIDVVAAREGQRIECTDEHLAVFANEPVPRERMFERD